MDTGLRAALMSVFACAFVVYAYHTPHLFPENVIIIMFIIAMFITIARDGMHTSKYVKAPYSDIVIGWVALFAYGMVCSEGMRGFVRNSA
jgi:hypothetical protein